MSWIGKWIDKLKVNLGQAEEARGQQNIQSKKSEGSREGKQKTLAEMLTFSYPILFFLTAS